MNRIDRLTAILIHLQSKPHVPLSELEDRFEVSRRTIFRDIRSLMEAGVPIGGDAGDGYFIVEGYHLPPVVFSKEEAGAILLGAKLIEKNADSQVSKNFGEALFKVKAVLRYRDKEFLDNLDSSISVIGSPLTTQSGFPDSHIADIQIALASRKVLAIIYHSNYNDQTTERTIEPLGLVHYSSRWHVIGYCRLREDFRDFRTDRIQKIRIMPESYDPSKYPNYLDFVHGMVGGTDAKEATILFSKKATRFIQEQKFYYGFIEERQVSDDEVEMKFLTPHYKYLAKWLMMFGCEATVVAPAVLQEMIATYSRELFEHHQQYAELAKP